MANPPSSTLPPPNPEHRRVAVSQFEHANQAVASGNYDYAVRLLQSCCKLDPGNLVYRQALRRTEKAKYHNNLRGSWFAWLTAWPVRAKMKAAMGGRDYLKVLEHGERVLTRNPWDVGVQMDMASAADSLGLLDVAVWCLEQARQKTARADDDFIKKNLYANVDYYSAIALYTIGIPMDQFTPLFGIARVPGWTAHVMEQWTDNRLIRPDVDYVGPMNLPWKPIEQRG